jgi:hypothetical protein
MKWVEYAIHSSSFPAMYDSFGVYRSEPNLVIEYTVGSQRTKQVVLERCRASVTDVFHFKHLTSARWTPLCHILSSIGTFQRAKSLLEYGEFLYLFILSENKSINFCFLAFSGYIPRTGYNT